MDLALDESKNDRAYVAHFRDRKRCSLCASATSARLARLYAHIAMPIEGLDAREELVVVPHVDEHLCVVLDALSSGVSGRGKHGERRVRLASEVAVRPTPNFEPNVR